MPQADCCKPFAEVDQRISKAVRSALHSTGYRDVAKLEFQVKDGVIMLSGSLPSYYLKQVAQEAVLRLRVALGVENSVVVQRN